MVSVDPPSGSPSCYNAPGPYAPTRGPDASLRCAELDWMLESLSGTSSSEVQWLQWLRGTVAGDTHWGWKVPSRPYFEGLALTASHDAQGKALADVGVAYSVGIGPRLVDLRGVEVVVSMQKHFSWLDGVGSQGSAGIVVRNSDGQVLVAALFGSFSEHAAELLPELRIRKGEGAGEPITSPCWVPTRGESHYRHRTVDVEVATQNSDVRLGPYDVRLGPKKVVDRVAIGCVEYLVCLQGAREMVDVGGCLKASDYHGDYLGVLLTRTDLLSK